MTFRISQILTTWINSFSSVLIITSLASATVKYFSFISRGGMDSGDSWGEGENERREGAANHGSQNSCSSPPDSSPQGRWQPESQSLTRAVLRSQRDAEDGFTRTYMVPKGLCMPSASSLLENSLETRHAMITVHDHQSLTRAPLP